MTLQKDPEGMETFYLNRSADFTGQHVLEIGCGEGRLTWRYAHAAARVTGIDLEMDALKVAASDCPADLGETVKFVRSNALDLPFPNETFNIAILSWSF